MTKEGVLAHCFDLGKPIAWLHTFIGLVKTLTRTGTTRVYRRTSSGSRVVTLGVSKLSSTDLFASFLCLRLGGLVLGS